MAKPITLYCAPHLNGNEPKDFVEAGRKLYQQAVQLRETLNMDVSQCLHGRNYQHLSEAQARQCRQIDIMKIEMIHKWLDEIEQVAIALNHKGVH